MSKRSAELLLQDILEAIEKIEQYTSNFSQQQFISDTKTIDAVVRNLEILGEATYRLPTVFKEKYPKIEWHKIIGLRHRIVHEYFGIDLYLVWIIIQKDLPSFKKDLLQILKAPGV